MNTNPSRILVLAAALSTALPSHAQQPDRDTQPVLVQVTATAAQTSRTSEVIGRFNRAFVQHDASLLDHLVAEDCVMESVEAGPDSRVVGRLANLKLWRNLANDRSGEFSVEEVVVSGERANIRWRYRSGPGLSQSVRGVTLMRLRDGLIVEALAYAKAGASDVGAAVRNAGDSK